MHKIWVYENINGAIGFTQIEPDIKSYDFRVEQVCRVVSSRIMKTLENGTCLERRKTIKALIDNDELGAIWTLNIN